MRSCFCGCSYEYMRRLEAERWLAPRLRPPAQHLVPYDLAACPRALRGTRHCSIVHTKNEMQTVVASSLPAIGGEVGRPSFSLIRTTADKRRALELKLSPTAFFSCDHLCRDDGRSVIATRPFFFAERYDGGPATKSSPLDDVRCLNTQVRRMPVVCFATKYYFPTSKGTGCYCQWCARDKISLSLQKCQLPSGVG